MTQREKMLYELRKKAIKGALSGEYPVDTYSDYGLNFIFLPFGENYKPFIITGTSDHNIMPFGNDFFITDANGNILSTRNFHTCPIFSPSE